ncbi:MAG: N-acetyltransferase [Bacteroidales bacterium]|nr:N-acetyltransferase [Bacteroidales bacterium]
MGVTIQRVADKKALKTFVDYPNKLYKGNPYFVPALFEDEIDTLDMNENPAAAFCKSELYLAYKDGELVGRVAAIINTRANEKWSHDEVRFGWIDFIDDPEVSKALIGAVEDFGRRNGMKTITGPLGFTDFDPEGMLIEGFEELSTQALIYNYPYYPVHLEALGFRKESDWLEYRITIPEALPPKYERISAMLRERYGLKVRKFSKKQLQKEDWGHKVFDLVNESYASLYNFTILPQEMVDKYVDTYLGLLDPKFVAVVTDSEENVVGFGIMMPSIVHALQKCGGKMFPFGWFHLLKSMYLKYEDTLELLLIGVKEEYRKKGVVALIFQDLLATARKAGFKYAETNAELESNYSMSTMWGEMEFRQHKRRRAYTKDI